MGFDMIRGRAYQSISAIIPYPKFPLQKSSCFIENINLVGPFALPMFITTIISNSQYYWLFLWCTLNINPQYQWWLVIIPTSNSIKKNTISYILNKPACSRNDVANPAALKATGQFEDCCEGRLLGLALWDQADMRQSGLGVDQEELRMLITIKIVVKSH